MTASELHASTQDWEAAMLDYVLRPLKAKTAENHMENSMENNMETGST